MFELERVELEQQNLEDSVERCEFEFAMAKKQHVRELRYYEMDWEENKAEIERLTVY